MNSSTWVAGHLTGGLGNRLFQHSAACGLSEIWKIPVVFYIPDCEKTNHGPFENIFKLFPSIPKVETTVPIQRLREAPNGAFTYESFPENPPSPFTTVDGWRQTSLYFPLEGVVPNFESALSKEVCQRLIEKYSLNDVEKFKTWFLHVRLGDYKILPHHQIDLNSYYSKAVEHIPKDVRILLFSDDIEAYGETFVEYFKKLGRTVLPVTVSDELETLYLMSQCWGGAVVANSTFSWWGAYFARMFHPNKEQYTAVYPAVWGRGLPKAKDIVPNWGIVIQNE